MARIFITGSADGLGLLAAKALINLGHEVVLHARSENRAAYTARQAPGAKDVLIADLSSIEETKSLAAKANAMATFDAVIHNAGVYQIPSDRLGSEGLPVLFAVNTLAPYILTALMLQSKRLIYLSSNMHLGGRPMRNKITHVTYSDTKLHVLILAKLVAATRPDVFANAVDPGWVPTKMGGAEAPDDLEKGYDTQIWLATSEEADAVASGKYYHRMKQAHYHKAADDVAVQATCASNWEQLTGVRL